MITEQTIRDVYIYLRKHDNSIPDETLDFMLHASIDALKGQWQPIEEAPKDWSSVLLYTPEFIPDEESDSEYEDENVCVGYFSCEDGGINMWLDASTDMPICPTHFMPLPSLPKQ